MSNLYDRPVSIVHAVSVGLWVTGLALIVLDLMGIWRTSPLGIYTTCIAGVLTIRGYICHLHQREVRAFQLGQESIRLVSRR